jgi:hypothetical protein
VIAKLESLVNERTVTGHRYSEAMRAPIDTEEPELA